MVSLSCVPALRPVDAAAACFRGRRVVWEPLLPSASPWQAKIKQERPKTPPPPLKRYTFSFMQTGRPVGIVWEKVGLGQLPRLNG